MFSYKWLWKHHLQTFDIPLPLGQAFCACWEIMQSISITFHMNQLCFSTPYCCHPSVFICEIDENMWMNKDLGVILPYLWRSISLYSGKLFILPFFTFSFSRALLTEQIQNKGENKTPGNFFSNKLFGLNNFFKVVHF